MKKIITLTLEIDAEEDGFFPSDTEIARDLMCEISCCCNHYEFSSITVEEAADDDS